MESSPSTPPPPPPTSVSRDDYDAVNAARKRFNPKTHFLSLPNLRRSRSTSQIDHPTPSADIQASTVFNADPISLDPSGLDDQDEYKDKYEWAMVYENQRGVTIFSIPYYSRLSLLPSDPSPFTVPNSTPDRSKESPISLDNYPLPNGNWRWVSKSWMIDMRSDLGEVQHDGFEYNWVFRTHKWRAEVGPLSAGGWVRRRRWVRLMMRPAKQNLKDRDNSPTATPTVDSPVDLPVFPPAKLPDSSPSNNSLNMNMDTVTVWSSNDVELNWNMCRTIMRKLGRDGRKLELWKTWLRQYHVGTEKIDRKGKERQTQASEDSTQTTVSSSSDLLAQFKCPPKEYLIPVLRRYGNALLSSFVYPDSRAELLNDLGLAGLLSELNIGLGTGWEANKVDFWSYTSELSNKS